MTSTPFQPIGTQPGSVLVAMQNGDADTPAAPPPPPPPSVWSIDGVEPSWLTDDYVAAMAARASGADVYVAACRKRDDVGAAINEALDDLRLDALDALADLHARWVALDATVKTLQGKGAAGPGADTAVVLEAARQALVRIQVSEYLSEPRGRVEARAWNFHRHNPHVSGRPPVVTNADRGLVSEYERLIADGFKWRRDELAWLVAAGFAEDPATYRVRQVDPASVTALLRGATAQVAAGERLLQLAAELRPRITQHDHERESWDVAKSEPSQITNLGAAAISS